MTMEAVCPSFKPAVVLAFCLSWKAATSCNLHPPSIHCSHHTKPTSATSLKRTNIIITTDCLTMTSFPIGSRVVLHGLKKDDFNGKKGVVRTAPDGERQQIFVDGNSYNLKMTNLKYEEKSCASLSIKEMKTILAAKGMEESEVTGMSKSELIGCVEEKCADSQERARHIAEANAAAAEAEAAAAKAKASSGKKGSSAKVNNANNLRSQADQLSNMSPAQLRQQAQALRSMPPAQIRRMNPMMKNFTDAQIAQAASQMEMMAANPAMFKQAAEQMKGMNQNDLEKMAAGYGANGGAGAAFPSSQYGTVPGTGGAGAGFTPEMMQQAQQQMSDMSPEQLRAQAEFMKSKTPNEIRALNPAMASMSDAQIQQATSQLEMMAANPELAKQAAEQMKGMSASDIEELRKCQESLFGKPGEGGGMPTDPSQMDLTKMDPKELKKMLGILKKNPAMLKSMMASQPGMAGKADGMSDEQLSKMIDGFDGMSENQIAMAMKAMSGWQQVNQFTGGYLGKIILVVVVLYVFLIMRFAMSWMFGGGSAGAAGGEEVVNDMLKEATMDAATATVGESDEFGGEL